MTDKKDSFPLSSLSEQAQPVALIHPETLHVISAGPSCSSIGVVQGECIPEGGSLGRLLASATEAPVVDSAVYINEVVWCINISACSDGTLLLQASGAGLLQGLLRRQINAESARRHDLRGLVGVMSSMTEYLIKHGEIPQEKLQIAHRIYETTAGLLGQLAFESKCKDLEFDESRLKRESVTLQELLHDPLAAVRSNRRSSGVEVTIDGETLMESRLVYMTCDVALVSYMLQELLKNSVHYAARDKVDLLIDSKEEDGEKYLYFSLTNKTPVSAIVSEAMFVKHCGEDPDGGGLGAYYARLVARVHGGDIWLDKEYTQGTRVMIKLPQNL
ncbi:MAG: sensor histidine kinase [Desulfovibrio sp.]